MSLTTNLLHQKYHPLVEAYLPKKWNSRIERLWFQEAGRTSFEKRKRADIACTTAYLPPHTDAREARSRPVSAADVQYRRKSLRAKNGEPGVRGDWCV